MEVAIAEGGDKVNSARNRLVKITYQQRCPNLCLGSPFLVSGAHG